MFEQKKLEQLEKELRSKPDDLDARVCLALLLAEQSSVGRREALRIFDQLMDQDIPLTCYAIALDIPFLVGGPKRAEAAAKKIPAARRWTQWRWWNYVIEYYAGKIDDSQMLELTGPFSNSGCVAYYVIGMKSLGQGERDKAIEYFIKARETRKVAWSTYHWGKAFAARLNDDSWPNWITSAKRHE